MTSDIHITQLKKYEYRDYLDQAVDYAAYVQQMAEDLALNPDPKIKEYIHLNQRRMHRVEKTYEIGSGMQQQIDQLSKPIHWLVITEHWCGDASQSLPVLQKLAEASQGRINLKMIYRDQHPALIEAFLTNGTKSIPKLIQLDEQMNLTGIWGPRPAPAQLLVKTLKANPETAATYANELHLWYAKNKQQDIEKELQQLIQQAERFCTRCVA